MEIVYLDGQKVNIVEPICSAIGFLMVCILDIWLW